MVPTLHRPHFKKLLSFITFSGVCLVGIGISYQSQGRKPHLGKPCDWISLGTASRPGRGLILLETARLKPALALIPGTLRYTDNVVRPYPYPSQHDKTPEVGDKLSSLPFITSGAPAIGDNPRNSGISRVQDTTKGLIVLPFQYTRRKSR